MGLYSEDLIGAIILKGTRDVIAANADLAAFFGRNIRAFEYEELEGSIETPFFSLCVDRQKYDRKASNEVEVDFSLKARIFLPRATPTNPNITAPAAPTITLGSGTPKTGTFLYRATSWDPDLGESFAGASVSTSPSAQKVTVTLPPSSGGYRLWRTVAGGLALRYLETLQPGVVSFVDDVPDDKLGDELAPIENFGLNLKDYVRLVLWANETLPRLSVSTADASLIFEDEKGAIDAARNLRVIQMKVIPHSVFNTETMQPVEEEVG